MTTEFDYFVLVTGNSRRQLHAISEEIDRVLEKEMSDHRMGIEGYHESRWICSTTAPLSFTCSTPKHGRTTPSKICGAKRPNPAAVAKGQE